MENYKSKYLKYKMKYLKLKGGCMTCWPFGRISNTNFRYTFFQCFAVLDENTIIGSGNVVNVGFDNNYEIFIWNPHTGRLINTLQGHTSVVNVLKILNENTLLSAGSDNTIRIWNLDNNECIHIVEVEGLINKLVYNESDNTAIYSVNRTLTLLNLDEYTKQDIIELDDNICDIHFISGKTKLACATYSNIVIMDLVDNTILHTMEIYKIPIPLSIKDENNKLRADWRYLVNYNNWDRTPTSLVVLNDETIIGCTNRIMGAEATPGEEENSQAIMFWNFINGELEDIFRYSEGMSAIVLLGDGNTFAIAMQDKILLLQLSTIKPILFYRQEIELNENIHTMLLMPDGITLICSMALSGNIELWNTVTKTLVARY